MANKVLTHIVQLEKNNYNMKSRKPDEYIAHVSRRGTVVMQDSTVTSKEVLGLNPPAA